VLQLLDHVDEQARALNAVNTVLLGDDGARGANTDVAGIVAALRELGRPLADAAVAAGARFVPLRHMRRDVSPLRDVLALLELVRLCRRERPDVVHTNSSKAGVLGRTAAWLARVPVRIFTVHGWAFSASTGLASRLYLLADRLMRPLTTLVVCVAENEREVGLRARTCRAERTLVVRNAVDVEAAPRAGHTNAVPRLVSVGRLSYPKDFPTFLDALARLGDREYRALVVGDGPDRAALEEELRRRPNPRLELAGERDAVPVLLAESDVFVLSSRSEGLPMSVLEAMAAGLPVVASRVGGVPELIGEDEAGFLVPPGEPAALAVALARLLDDVELRRRVGEAARRRAAERFDLRRFHREHLELYGRVLEGAGRPRPAETGKIPT
jgi:glycosyltransferase involved in cell wall biosynthesis